MSWDIAGKRVVLTGGTTGIGRATVEALVGRGAHVVFTARDAAAGDRVVEELAGVGGEGSVTHRRLALDDLSSIRTFAGELAAELDHVDVLVNNAGVVMTERRTTVDGFEFTMGVNHLGHVRLVKDLLPLLEAAPAARIVVVASDAHRFARGLDLDDLQAARGRFGALRGMRVYAGSKLANVLFTRELARRLPAEHVTVNCLHPGAVRTRLGRDGEQSRLGELVWPVVARFCLTPEEGAATSVWAATAPELEGVTGRYLAKEAIASPSRVALDDDLAARLWGVSDELVGG